MEIFMPWNHNQRLTLILSITILLFLTTPVQPTNSSKKSNLVSKVVATNNMSVPIENTTASLETTIPTKKSKPKGKHTKVNSTLTYQLLRNDAVNSTASIIPGKLIQPKQSWLAVASAVAHSAAGTDNKQQIPGSDESKPTKYHYYPHNQHLYLLPECATQQVCSAVYLRLNYSQPLCACPNTHRPCSVSTRTDDRHTIPLVTGAHSQILTLVKTCEPTQEVRECRAPKDWSILALQNSRTGKAHYLVICRCPSPGYLEGPIAHSQPAYARVPGIRVYGMTCVRLPNRTGREVKFRNMDTETKDQIQNPEFPWNKLKVMLEQAASENS